MFWPMDAVQERLANLKEKGWSLAAIATEMEVSYNAIQKWNAGERKPSNVKAVLQSLDALCKRRRVPKRRRTKSTRESRIL